MKKQLLRAFLGFLSAALSVLVFHQSILFVLNLVGVIQVEAWSTAPHGPMEVPRILNGMFWGGLWGAVYGLVQSKTGHESPWLPGALLGFSAAFLGNFLLVPMFKGQPLFLGGDMFRIFIVLLVHTGFGIGTAFLYSLALKKPKRVV